MIYHYVVTIKNQHSRLIDIIGFLLSGVSVLFFVIEMINSVSVGLAYLLGSVFIIAVLAWNIYQSRRRRRKVYYSRALLIAALVWMKMPYFQWLSFLFIILALLEYQAKYSVEIGFSDKEIVLNTFFKKKYSWAHFSNIVLKDGIITLDFANNKVWQREIDEDEEDDASEEEFNHFCQSQLARTQPA